MTIAENVTAGLKLTGTRVSRGGRADLVEECLTKAGLWVEVRDRLREPGGGLSGGQQQPCSALDPTSTRRIEETIHNLRREVTIVIVTHNMQQAARVSQHCAFFLAEQGTPGQIVEAGATEVIFNNPADSRTEDYVNGRFG